MRIPKVCVFDLEPKDKKGDLHKDVQKQNEFFVKIQKKKVNQKGYTGVKCQIETKPGKMVIANY